MKPRKGSWDQWLDRAVAGILFTPDQDQVRQELRAHLEDKREALARAFPTLSEELLEQRALADMGDAQTLGQALARLHRPWWGWLWMASRALLVAAVAMLLLELAAAAGILWDVLVF